MNPDDLLFVPPVDESPEVVFATIDATNVPAAVKRDSEGRVTGLVVDVVGEGRFVWPLIRECDWEDEAREVSR